MVNVRNNDTIGDTDIRYSNIRCEYDRINSEVMTIYISQSIVDPNADKAGYCYS